MAKKSEIVNIILLCVAAPIVMFAGFFLLDNDRYYVAAAAIIVLSMVPFFVSFEKKGIKVRELAVIAAVTAIAVASRAAFYAYPQVKPIAAVIIIAAASFGYEAGFLTGALSMLLSNIIFGQGMWTPFQMLGLGMVGLICGFLFRISKIRNSRIFMSLTGGLVTFFVYGLIVDSNSVLMMVTEYSFSSVFAVYANGALLNITFAVVTAVILFFFGKTFISILERLKIKYGLFAKGENV